LDPGNPGYQQDLTYKGEIHPTLPFYIYNPKCYLCYPWDIWIFSLTIDHLPLAFVICVTETENAGRLALQVKLQLVRIPPKPQMDVDLFKYEVCKYHQLP
jgi:hypothetical protein